MTRHAGAGPARVAALAAVSVLAWTLPAVAQEHRAEQDREITYWLQDPATHSFRISHDFTVDREGERYVHNFVRAGSEVSAPVFTDLNRGMVLEARRITGAELNAMDVYDETMEDDAVVIQAELAGPLPAGHTVRVRVEETYTDPGRYTLEGGELVWDRTLGRPRNVVFLPEGWMLTGLSTPAVVFEDAGRVGMRFINPRNDSLHVVIRARPRR